MFLARKVTRAKWDSSEGIELGELPADAVTADLRTTWNTLSFWKCGADDGALTRVALTLAAAGQRVDKVELVWLDPKDLETDGIRLDPNHGRTPVASMVDQHVDAVGLDYVRLGRVASHMKAALERKQYRLWSRSKVREILVMGVEGKLVDLDRLEEKVQEEVRAAIKKRKDEHGR